MARTAEIVGSRWTALILRDLPDNPAYRYQQFEQSIPGIPPSTLTARLKMLESHGIIARRQYDDHPPRHEYYLTEKGQNLRPIIRAMREWGETQTGHWQAIGPAFRS